VGFILGLALLLQPLLQNKHLLAALARDPIYTQFQGTPSQLFHTSRI